jgi:hypothetical protein
MADNFDNTIDQYYSLVDKNLISNLCKNNNLKNLIKLSTISELYVFNKKNKKWYLKSKDKLLKECENIKKKELKTSSIMLSNLAKLNNNHDVSNIKDICETLQTKIIKLDNIINCINHIDIPIKIIPIQYESTDQTNHNIVSFNEIKELKSKKISKYIPTIITSVPEKVSYNNLDYLSKEQVNKYNQSLSDNSDSFIECYSNC